jgi:hypothetical protein
VLQLIWDRIIGQQHPHVATDATLLIVTELRSLIMSSVLLCNIYGVFGLNETESKLNIQRMMALELGVEICISLTFFYANVE